MWSCPQKRPHTWPRVATRRPRQSPGLVTLGLATTSAVQAWPLPAPASGPSPSWKPMAARERNAMCPRHMPGRSCGNLLHLWRALFHSRESSTSRPRAAQVRLKPQTLCLGRELDQKMIHFEAPLEPPHCSRTLLQPHHRLWQDRLHGGTKHTVHSGGTGTAERRVRMQKMPFLESPESRMGLLRRHLSLRRAKRARSVLQAGTTGTGERPMDLRDRVPWWPPFHVQTQGIPARIPQRPRPGPEDGRRTTDHLRTAPGSHTTPHCARPHLRSLEPSTGEA
mmetsp:Transcript_23420/g.68407  ORF Transcript_23420/g.68407 Transcript_23420/m.68407 type:complete len:280 (+) Transcript_23420:244-1083(+)